MRVRVNQQQVSREKSKAQWHSLCRHGTIVAGIHLAVFAQRGSVIPEDRFVFLGHLTSLALDKDPIQSFLFPTVKGHSEPKSDFRFSSLMMMTMTMTMTMIMIMMGEEGEGKKREEEEEEMVVVVSNTKPCSKHANLNSFYPPSSLWQPQDYTVERKSHSRPLVKANLESAQACSRGSVGCTSALLERTSAYGSLMKRIPCPRSQC